MRLPPRPRSLHKRMFLASLAVTSACLLLLTTAVSTGLFLFLRNRFDQIVVERLDYYLARLDKDMLIPESAVGGMTSDSHAFVIDADGTVLQHLGSEDPVPEVELGLLRDLADREVVGILPDHQHRAAVAERPGGGYVVTAWSPAWVKQTVLWVIALAVITTPTILAIIASAIDWAGRAVLRPLNTLTRTVEGIAEEGLRERVVLNGAPHEVTRLGQSFNTMMDRLEEAFGHRRSAEERLRRFLGDAGHELRTPLTALDGYLQLWRLGALDREASRETALRHMEIETRRMTVLVEEMTLLARLNENRTLERHEVCLAEVCLAAVGGARVIDPERHIRVEVHAEEHIVLGDPERLHQVVSNLLSNVRAHTPPGTEAALRLWCDGDESVIDVRDDGPGIPPEARERIFERRFRAVEEDGTARCGLGLGLHIAAEAVAAHEGTIRVVPNEGGAWFQVRLPRSGER